MSGVLLAVIIGVWLVIAVFVVIVIARMISRADEASEMASLGREVRRADSAALPPAPVEAARTKARAPWTKSTGS